MDAATRSACGVDDDFVSTAATAIEESPWVARTQSSTAGRQTASPLGAVPCEEPVPPAPEQPLDAIKREICVSPRLPGTIWILPEGMASSGRNDTGEPVVQHCVMLIEAAMRYLAMALSPRGKAVGRNRRALCLVCCLLEL